MDDQSFHAFVYTRWPALVRFAWTLTGDRGHAEDVVQTVLERCWGRREGIRDGQADAYVRAAVVNEVISGKRKLGRRPRETRFVANELDASVAAQTVRGGMDFTETGARSMIIWQELQSLPLRMRAVVVLRFLEDLSEAHTAEILGCSVGTVKSQTAKAMARLRNRAGLRDLMGAPAQEEMT